MKKRDLLYLRHENSSSNLRFWALSLLSSLCIAACCFLTLLTPTSLMTPTADQMRETVDIEPTATASRTPEFMITSTPAPTPIPLPTGTSCTRNTSWFSYIVQPGDSLDLIAQYADITVTTLTEANCLQTERVIEGDRLYVPKSIAITRTPNPLPSPTETGRQTTVTCTTYDETCFNDVLATAES